MIRTKKSIEEEARVKWIDQPIADPIVLKTKLWKTLYKGLFDRVVEWGAAKGKRVLIVGLEDGGELALRFLKEGMFVTVVDPSVEAGQALRKKADQLKIGLGLNVFADFYMKRTFSLASFDLICFFSALNRFTEPFVVIRKAKRELKVGGQIFARLNVRPHIPVDKVLSNSGVIDKVPDKLKNIVGGVVDRIAQRVKQNKVISTVASWPTVEEAIENFKKDMTLQDVVYMHPLLGLITLPAVAMDRDIPEKLVGVVQNIEAKIPENWIGMLGGSVALFGAKENELGRTFNVGRR